MIVGILSDTHGRALRARRAIQVLRQAGATTFLHCGDIGDARVYDELAGEQAWFVWGNSDDPGPLLEQSVAALGLNPPVPGPLRVEFGAHSLIMCHGHEPAFNQLLRAHTFKDEAVQLGDLQVDYILHGHTHMAHSERLLSGALLINPGALHRALVYTVATLDLSRGVVDFWVVDETQSPTAPLRPYTVL
ncbi:MAG: YfcE family phosphodiesterase [Phycisphaerae bacterium]|nr:YfcE family phosphodiesterase [Phycisphaerae bacterium]